MPPKKKNKNSGKSPFFHFLQDTQRKHGAMSMREVTDIAGQLWEKMGPTQRRPYELMAAAFKNNVQQKKYTSEGIDIEQLDKEQEEQIKWYQTMIDFINSDIQEGCKYNTIQKKMFFVVDFNLFCYHESEDTYYPAEVGLVGFNLEDGVLQENIYHAFINPGDLPIGFYSMALQNCNETHKINPPFGTGNVNNMETVFTDIWKFVNSRQDGRGPCVLYAKEKYMGMIKKILDAWSLKYKETQRFEVYNLQLMFNVLRSDIDTTEEKMPQSFGFHEISKDVYSHVSSISCDYHSQMETQVFCSKSKVLRAAYVICDNCCPVLGINLILGQHIPETVAGSRQLESRASNYSSYASSTTQGDDTERWESKSTTSTIVDNFPTLDERYGRNKTPVNDWSTVKNNTRGSKAGLSTRRNAALSSLVQRVNDVTLCPKDESTNTQESKSANLNYTMSASLGKNSGPQLQSEREFPSLGRTGGIRGRGNIRGMGRATRQN